MTSGLVVLLYSLTGGFFMGTYPAFIKTKTVVQANVPPIIFQLYKTTWVFVLGFLFLIPRSFQPRVIGEPLFVFSWWGFMSAVLWVPAGMATIASVPMVGMGYQVATACSFSSLLSFIIFTTLASNGSAMKAHSCGHNCTYYLAPFYLILMIAGMLSMVFAPNIVRSATFRRTFASKLKRGIDCSDNFTDEEEKEKEKEKEKEDDDDDDDDDDKNNQDDLEQESRSLFLQSSGSRNTATSHRSVVIPGRKKWFIGTLLALATGIFASGMNGLVELGRLAEEKKYGCSLNATQCPWQVKEQFNLSGSWFVSFGFGALVVTLLWVAAISAYNGTIPSLHWKILKVPGSMAGIFWVLGNTFITMAVVSGGNAIAVPQSLAAMLITSGAWGMLFYKEGDNASERLCWAFSAGFTLVAMILLGREKIQTQ